MEQANYKSLQGAAKDLAEVVTALIEHGRVLLGTPASAAIIRAHTSIVAILELETEDRSDGTD